MHFRNHYKFCTFFLIVLLTFISFINVNADQEIKVYINNQPLLFDVNPVIQEGRTLVPFRAVFEAIDADISWNVVTRTAIGVKENIRIELPIGQNHGVVNQNIIELDTPATIINGRTMVPLRFVSENMGFEVVWDGTSRSIYLTNSQITSPLDTINRLNQEFTFNNLAIGNTSQELITELGEPNRIDVSIFDMQWYIYNSNYNNYIQIGVKNDKIVAFYTNNAFWQSKQGISFGSTKNQMNNILGQPEDKNILANKILLYENINKYSYEKTSIWAFWDQFNENRLTAVFIIDSSIESELETLFPNQTDTFVKSAKMQTFDQLNTARVNSGLKALSWDGTAARSAELHSQDMAKKDFFAHENLEGLSPFQRMENEGINYYTASENIAAQQPISFFAHADWMNSAGHRKNILGDFTHVGTGVAFGGTYKIYYAQNFFSPR